MGKQRWYESIQFRQRAWDISEDTEQEDCHIFPVEVYGSYRIEVQEINNHVAVGLYGPNNMDDCICSGIITNPNENGFLTCDRFLQPGEYYAKIRHKKTSDTTGSGYHWYRIALLPTPVPLTVNGNPILARMSAGKQYNWYEFTVEIEADYIIEVQGITDFSLYFEKRADNSGHNDAWHSYNGRVEYRLDPGKYYLAVERDSGSATDYKIGVRFPITELTINGTPENCSVNSQSGERKEQWFEFTVESDGDYMIEALTNDHSALEDEMSQSNQDASSMILYGPDNLDSFYAGCDKRVLWNKNPRITEFLKSGKYLLKVGLSETRPASAWFYLTVKDKPTELAINGVPISGSVTRIGEDWYTSTVCYTFIVKDKGEYIVETKATSDLDMYLYGPLDTSISHYGQGVNTKISCSLDPGVYRIKIRPKAVGTIDYTIGIGVKTPEVKTVDVKPVKLEIDATPISEHLTTPSKEDVYEFSVISGDYYAIKTLGKLDPGDYSLKMELTSSNTGDYTVGVERCSFVEIQEIHTKHNQKDKADQYVEIVNNGTETVDLSNWKLTSSHNPKEFTFPQGVNLGGGKTIRVYSNEKPSGSSPDDLIFGEVRIWSKQGDTATLFDANGQKVCDLGIGDNKT
ncbi:lamin tail domain-containing protein [Crocosphaera sp.]|uniref:lamin tail domain-containing protein n=1 Tax=Crocosphaera sp. TaxID=2729996 RepID=UPI00262F3266|nr:lamin tail domain-containing protein [Crocosphaera sp.]MDJ0583202.1 lamin tail domain-containing protein [Crocosphaera sp.]